VVRVKICGITNREDAIASAVLGADALGFIFYPASPRYIAPKKLKRITALIPEKIIKIGVFVNAKEKLIKNIARTCKLNMLQFHGNESPQFCQRFKGFKIIKSFRIKDKLDLAEIAKYKTHAYLFDTFTKTKFGGTGKSFDWRLLKDIRKLKRPIFLSGGLNAENILEAVRIVHPDWVDVATSVEIRPGGKDYKRIREFIKKVRGLRDATG